jgi:hypothetical protein
MTDVDEAPEDDDWQPEPRPVWVKVALIAAALALIALVVVVAVHLTGSNGNQTVTSPTTQPTPEGVPVQNVPDLAPADTTVKGTPVDGITCTPTMSIRFHIHVHLDIFVNGKQYRIPPAAGMKPPLIAKAVPGGIFYDNAPTGCVYWLHVHTDDGIIHVEAPQPMSFVLGEFFDIWNQPLSSTQVGPDKGPVVAFVNGKVFPGDPRNIPLLNHEVVQLDVGTPVVKFIPMTFNVTGLCSTTCGLGS